MTNIIYFEYREAYNFTSHGKKFLMQITIRTDLKIIDYTITLIRTKPTLT
jgi:hypothetical protein